MRLIDADKLIETFKDYPFGDDSMSPQAAIDVIDGFADANRSLEMYEKKKLETFIAVRDILKESGNALAYNNCYHTPWGFYGKHSVAECLEFLLDKYTVNDKNCSTKAETESVKHGKWESITNGLWGWRCSACGKKVYSNRKCDVDRYKYPYCPNCGAKMKGVMKNETD